MAVRNAVIWVRRNLHRKGPLPVLGLTDLFEHRADLQYIVGEQPGVRPRPIRVKQRWIARKVELQTVGIVALDKFPEAAHHQRANLGDLVIYHRTVTTGKTVGIGVTGEEPVWFLVVQRALNETSIFETHSRPELDALAMTSASDHRGKIDADPAQVVDIFEARIEWQLLVLSNHHLAIKEGKSVPSIP